MPTMLDSALDLASRGLRVFPCSPRTKAPHTPNGFHDATTDPATIRQWWSRWQEAAIGIATGDGLAVVDLDPRNSDGAADWREMLQDLESECGALPETWTAITGGGGLHIYLRTNGTALTCRTNIRPGLDLKADGGYVIAPPSGHASGARYMWETDPDVCAMATIPHEWETLVASDRATTGPYEAPSAPVTPGSRNSQTIRFVGAMRHYGLGGGGLAAVAQAYNLHHNDPPLPDREISSMVATAERWDRGTPAVVITRAIMDGDGTDTRKAMPWETVSDTDVVRIIYSHPLLAPIAKAFGAAAKPSLPASVTIPRALVMAGCAMAQPVPGWSTMTGSHGAELARLRIETGGGQTTNMWHLLVAPSGTGKDIGNVADALANSEGWLLAGGGSAEGLAEGMAETPAGLILIGEFENWIDRNHWQAGARPFVTEAFQKGRFKARFSKGRTRESHYAYPSIMANVQPEILASKASFEHLSAGFLPRFMVSAMPHGTHHRPRTGRLETWHQEAFTALAVYKTQDGSVAVPEDYLDELYMDTLAGHDAPYAPHWKRLVNEYGPKIATVLAVDGHDVTPVIQDRHWQDTTTILLWLYRQAADAFDGIAQPGEAAAVNQRYAILLKHYQDEYRRTKRPVDPNGPVRARRPRMPAAERDSILEMMVTAGDLVPKDSGFVPRRTR